VSLERAADEALVLAELVDELGVGVCVGIGHRAPQSDGDSCDARLS
jgi:hypothetical protein